MSTCARADCIAAFSIIHPSFSRSSAARATAPSETSTSSDSTATLTLHHSVTAVQLQAGSGGTPNVRLSHIVITPPCSINCPVRSFARSRDDLFRSNSMLVFSRLLRMLHRARWPLHDSDARHITPTLHVEICTLRSENDRPRAKACLLRLTCFRQLVGLKPAPALQSKLCLTGPKQHTYSCEVQKTYYTDAARLL